MTGGPQAPASPAPGAPGAAQPGVDLLLAWHMHQPDYRDLASGEFTMPWVYLHAIKDYSDMAWHLEQNPGMRAVVNFVPVLLEQIEDYCDQFATGRLRDPLLRVLARGESTPLGADERALTLDRCFRANHTRLIEPYAPYRRLHEFFTFAGASGADSFSYFSDRYFYDLIAWYHLSWMGESVRRANPELGMLMERGTGFGEVERARILALIGREMHTVIPRYRALAERGQVELTATPQCHPLSPLLLDLGCARETLPDAPLPEHAAYPGGRESVFAHLDEGLASHARRFGAAPLGIWPAEGALSEAFASILASRGIAWTASSEAVLRNSLRRGGGGEEAREQVLYRPWKAPAFAGETLFVFRDDRLSDLIGFEYSRWHGADAAAHFLHELESIADGAGAGPRPLVSVILDGENAWEYYPFNGFWFFTDFYRGLSTSPRIRTLTGADVVGLQRAASASVAAPGQLTAIAAGSWVYGNLATWIGSPDKNRAWDLLCEAKEAYDRVFDGGTLGEEERAKATRQLRDCEASDWFWWPGEYNPGSSVSAFESLFRTKLANLYRLLGLDPPDSLSHSFSTGGGEAETGGTMRRATA
jgi:alpha-amylase/alpha-mannosidase (GH57 family)